MQIERDRRFKTEQMIIENATKNFPFFTKLIRKGYHRQVTECYKVMTPLSFKKGECVFYQGDIADNFYILLRGKVTIITQKDQETIEKERQHLTYDEYNQIQNYISQLQFEKDVKRQEITALKSTSILEYVSSSLTTKTKSSLNKLELNSRKNSLSSIGESSPLSQSFSEYSPKKNTNRNAKIVRQQTKSKFQSRQESVLNTSSDILDESPSKFSQKKLNFKFLADKVVQLLEEGNQQRLNGIGEEINQFGKNENIENEDNSQSPMSNYSLDSPVKYGRKVSYFQASKLSLENGNSRYEKEVNNKQRLIVPELPANLFIEDISHPIKLFQNGIYLYSFANTIKEGESFGEGGLILRRPRTATVICNQDCDFAAISRQDYDLILKEVQNKKINKKISLLVQNMDKNIPFQTASRLCFAFFKLQLSFNQPVFLQGEIPSYVYFLKKGEIEIVLNERVQSLKKKQHNLISHEGEDEKAANQMKITGSFKTKSRTLSSISDGQFFGEEDVLNNSNERTFTAREFRFILSQSSSVKEFFTNRMQQKQEWRVSQQKKVGNTVEQLDQPERKQKSNQDFQDSNQIVSGVEDIDKIIQFCQDRQIISPQIKKRRREDENFTTYLNTQMKIDETRNKIEETKNKIEETKNRIDETKNRTEETRNRTDTNKSIPKQTPNNIQKVLTMAQKRQKYLSSKRPQSASEIYTTSNFIMTANKNNKQYVKERGGELYSNENPHEQKLFQDDYKTKVKDRLEKFQQQQRRRQQSSSPPATAQKIQSQQNIAQSEIIPTKKAVRSERRSLQEYQKKYVDQTPRGGGVKSLVSIQEFNFSRNEEEEDQTQPIQSVPIILYNQQKNIQIKDEQYFLNLSMINKELGDQQNSLVFSVNNSPRMNNEEEFQKQQGEHKTSSFQIQLHQFHQQKDNNFANQERFQDKFVTSNDISPRVVLVEKKRYLQQNNLSYEKLNFQMKVKMQEQLRKSNRNQRNQHLQNLIKIQDSLINSTTSLVNFKNPSFAIYPANITNTPTLANVKSAVMLNSINDIKTNFEIINPFILSPPHPTSLNNQTNINKNGKKMIFKVQTPKSINETTTNYSIPKNFQNSQERPQTAKEYSQRTFKHNSMHQFQQVTNENSIQTPSSTINTPSKSGNKHTSQNKSIDERRQIASAQIDFIKKFQNHFKNLENHKASLINEKVSQNTKTSQVENQQTISTNLETHELISTKTKEIKIPFQRKLLSPNQNRPKTAFHTNSNPNNELQTKSMTNLDYKTIIKNMPSCKTQRPQTVISTVYMSPETQTEFQTKSKLDAIKQQFSDRLNFIQIDQQLSFIDFNMLEDNKSALNHLQIQTHSNNKGNQYQKTEIPSTPQHLQFGYSLQKGMIHKAKKISSEKLLLSHKPKSSTIIKDQNLNEQEMRSPNIINIIFPQKEKKISIQKNSHHRKQISLNFYPQQFPLNLRSTDKLTKKTENTGQEVENNHIFSKDRLHSSLQKNNADFHYQVNRIPQVRQIVQKQQIQNY